MDAKVQLPLVGEVSATASRENSEDTRRFEKIVSVLERSAPPYTDEVSTGTWVSFWVPMTYTIIEAIRLTSEGEDSPVRYGPALAFIDVDAGGELSVPRLMLHGDADNLVGIARSSEPPRISPWRMVARVSRSRSLIACPLLRQPRGFPAWPG